MHHLKLILCTLILSVFGAYASDAAETQVAAGAYHGLLLDADGQVWAWGGNAYGQIGINSTGVDQATPQSVKYLGGSNLNRLVQIAAGSIHSLGLRDDGTVWGWGYNAQGQVGDGSVVNRAGAVQVQLQAGGVLTGVKAVSAGYYHSMALKTDGTVWTWGSDAYSALGNGSGSAASKAVQVTGLSNMIAIGAGAWSSYAVRVDGTVWAWGYGGNSSLGNGSSASSSTPVQVKINGGATSYLTGVLSVHGGCYAAWALTDNGNVYGWGLNGTGQLGNGSTTESTYATYSYGFTRQMSASPFLANPVSETYGLGGHQAALYVHGFGIGAGRNDLGQLGYGNTINQSSVVVANPQFTNSEGNGRVKQVAAGGAFTLHLLADGSVRAAGDNSKGQLGNGALGGNTTSLSQVTARWNLAGIQTASAGANHTLLLKADGTVWGMGNNAQGQVDGTSGGSNLTTPVQVLLAGSPLTDIIAISAGGQHSMALRNDGRVFCWGSSGFGQAGSSSGVAAPQAVWFYSRGISAGGNASYSLDYSGLVYSWGWNIDGELGNNDAAVTSRSAPGKVLYHNGSSTVNLDGVRQVEAGGYAAMAVRSNGTSVGWGYNGYNQMAIFGFGGFLYQGRTTAPVVATSPLTNILSVSIGGQYQCAWQMADGTVRTCGYSGYGQLGIGGSTASPPASVTNPVTALGISGARAKGLSSGTTSGEFNVVVLDNGTALACGVNGFRQIGNNDNAATPANVFAPTSVLKSTGGSLSQIASASAGDYHAAYVLSDGTVWTVGNDGQGQLGDGGASTTQSRTVAATPMWLPQVGIAATTNNAFESGATPGVYTLTRSGSTSGAVDIGLSISGASTVTTTGVDADIVTLPTVVTIPAGSSTTTVNVTPIDDAIAEDGEALFCQLTTTTTARAIAGTAKISVVDNDTAGIRVRSVGGSVLPVTALPTSEAGGLSQFEVVLNSKPLSNVTVNLGSDNLSEGIVGPVQLTFLPANWNTPQVVTITGQNDTPPVVDGAVAYTATVSNGVSFDAKYNGLAPNRTSIACSNADDDTASVTGSGTALFVRETPRILTKDLTVGSTPSTTVTFGPYTANAFYTRNTTYAIFFTLATTSQQQEVTVGSSVQVTASSGPFSGSTYSGLVTTVDTFGTDFWYVLVDTPFPGLANGTEVVTLGSPVYNIALTSKPSADVTVNLAANSAGAFPNPASVTFTPGTWNVAQKITVQPIDDDYASGNKTPVIVHTVTSDDANFDGITVTNTPVTVLDDDVAGVLLSDVATNSPNPALALSEGGNATSYYVRLTSRPATSVTLTINATPAGQVVFPIAGTNATSRTLTFTNTDWSSDQTVVVQAVDDNDIENSHPSISLTHQSSGTGTQGYDSTTTWGSLSVAMTDNDNAGILTSAPALFTVNEGGTNQIGITLKSRPSQPVTVQLSINNTGAAPSPSVVWQGGGAQVTFSNVGNDWNTPKLFDVTTGTDVNSASEFFQIIAQVVGSSDGNYYNTGTSTGISTNVAAQCLDKDQPGITIQQRTAANSADDGVTTVTEGVGAGDRLQVRLNVPATAAGAYVLVQATTDGQTTVSPSTLIFDGVTTPYLTTQLLNIQAVDDNVYQGGTRSGTITFQVTATNDVGAPKYTTFINSVLPITITDNDTRGVSVSPTTGLVTTEAGGQAAFGVRLLSQPSAGNQVVVTLASGNPTEVLASPTTLTFLPANWNIAQTITLTGQPDQVADGDKTIQVSLAINTVTTTDPFYLSQVISPVSVTNVDVDTRAIVLSATALSLSEATAGGTYPHSLPYTLRLQSKPTGTVTINLANNGQIAVSPTSLKFGPIADLANGIALWSAAQTIQVTATNDDIDEDGIHQTVVTHTVAGADYTGVLAASVTVSIEDNDTAGVLVTGGPLIVREGVGTPLYPTVVSVTDGTGTPTNQIQLPAGTNLTTAQVGAKVRLFALNAAIGSPNSGKLATITAINSTTKTIRVAETLVANPTGGDEVLGIYPSFTVALRSQPTANVVVPLSSSDISAGALVQSNLLFTPVNWQTTQVVTVYGVDDSVAQGTRNWTAQVERAQSADTGYAGLAASGSPAVSTLDDDTAGFTITPGGTVHVNEAGVLVATMGISLSSQPTAAVAAALTAGTDGAGKVQGALNASSLTFDAINWNTVQNFTITGIANGDNADNGSAGKAWSVSVAATSTDTGYSGVTGTIAVITDRSNAAPALPKPSNLVINEDSTATTVMVNGVGTGESGEVQGLSAVLTAVPANVVTLGTPTIDQVAGTLVFTVTPIADQNGTVTVTIALTDDAAIDGTAQTTTQNFTVTVTAVNDAPVIDVDGPGAASTTVAYIAGSFIEKAAAVAVVDVSALIVSDIDSATLISATAVLAAAPDGSSEILAATAGSGLNTTWNSTTRTLTIQAASPQPLSAFQSVLRSLTYSDSSLNPTAGVRTITVQVNDGAAQSVGAQSTVTVVPVNDASVVQLGGVGVPDHAAVTYPEQSPPVAVCMEAVVSDVDNANQSGFTAMLAAQPDGSSEVLSVNLGGIAGLSQSYVGGILTVTGSATVAEYQTVLASLAYQNTSLNPTANPNRTITVVMSDGSANSTSRQTQVVVVPVNDAAVVDLNGVSAGTGWASTWTEAAGPVAIVDPAALTISDVDSATATQARVILTSVPDGTAESLSVTATGLTVSYVSGTLSLVGTAPLSTYETVLRTLSYDSSSRNPTGTSRTVTVEINDGTLWSASATAALTITPVNDQPVVDLNGVLGGADVVATHTEGQAPALQPFNAAILTDVDNSLLSALTVTATSAPLPDDGTVVNGAAAIEDLTFDTTGTSVTASWSAAAASLTLLGPATVVEFQQVLRTVAYRNTSKSPAPTTRVFTVRANDGSALSGAQTATINVVSVNDVPQVQVGTLAVTRAGTVLITSRLPAPIGNPTTGTLAATDVETAAASLVFTLTLSPNQGKLQRQVGVLWNDVVPSSTFTQQEVLNGAIRYVHSNGISSSDGFAVTATDGNGAVSAFNVVTIAINVGLIQPVVTLQGADPSWTEGTGPVVLNTNATVNDPDFIDLIGGSLTVNVTGGVSGTASLERLAIRNQGTALGQVGVSGSTVTYSGVVIGTIATDGIGQPLVVTFNTFTNTDAVAAIIANLTWDFVGKVPGVAGTNDRSITFVVDDGKGGTLVTPAVRTVAIIPVNDPPAAAAIAFTTAKGLDLAASVQPADPEGLSVTVTKLSNPLRGAVTMQTDGSFVYSPYAGESGADTFTVRLNDGAVTADQVVSVRITGGSDARPWITSDPPMETRVGELLRYGVQADDSEVPAGTTVLWELVGAPTGMTISSTGPLTSAVQWTAVMPTTTSYVTFSIVARISASSGVAVQTVTLKVLSTPVGGG